MEQTLEIATWAQAIGGRLVPTESLYPLCIFDSDAKACVMVGKQPESNTPGLNAVRIRLEAGAEMSPHQHDYEHLLIVIKGRGTLSYAQKEYPVSAGSLYRVGAQVEHGLKTLTGLDLISISSVFISPDSSDRLKYTK